MPLFAHVWTDFIGKGPAAENRVLKLFIPSGLKNLSVITTNEYIAVSAIAAESVTLDSNGWDVTFESIDAAKSIALTVKNGDVSGVVVGGWGDYSITCSVKKGKSNLPESKAGGGRKIADGARQQRRYFGGVFPLRDKKKERGP